MDKLIILGAGAGGLAAGYYARKNGVPFTIYEASERIGGNSTTLQYKGFLFDSGAHRFHDRYPEITREMQMLLGTDFKKIEVPSQIYSHRAYIDFPLSPMNLIKNIGVSEFLKSGLEVIAARIGKKKNDNSFAAYALETYGKTMANRFLLNYSEKLWGKPCTQLSADVAGKRLKGLDLKTFLVETLSGNRSKTEHLDGAFFYPGKGIGMIADHLAKYCGEQHIVKNSIISKILHNGKKITRIEINGSQAIPVKELVSTLPMSSFIQMMEPHPPDDILSLSKALKFRHVILIIFLINQASVTQKASLYFPDADLPFTRIYEPKNRSAQMSPANKTSVIVEIPCQQEDAMWRNSDDQLANMVRKQICEIGILNDKDIFDSTVFRMKFAYPVLELGADEKILKIRGYLDKFDNLKITGRNGKFVYTHIHDMMKFGQEIIAEYLSRADSKE
jgi:protoporphyrinogen oxidase